VAVSSPLFHEQFNQAIVQQRPSPSTLDVAPWCFRAPVKSLVNRLPSSVLKISGLVVDLVSRSGLGLARYGRFGRHPDRPLASWTACPLDPGAIVLQV
jgi:hypothetical protein